MTVQLRPVADLWEWQHQGLCRLASPEVFFHPEGERGPARRWREARAVAICHQCPVLEQCRAYAVAADEPYGVWGGLTEDERGFTPAHGSPPSPTEPRGPDHTEEHQATGRGGRRC